MGGILYPVGSLAKDVTNLGLLLDICPTADDIWFKAMSLANGTQVRRVCTYSMDFPLVISSQRHALYRANVSELRNDIQFLAVMNHFSLLESVTGSSDLGV
jgi:hypothetical protein